MTGAPLALTLLAGVLVWVVLIRSAPRRLRVLVDAVGLATTSGVLLATGGSPLRPLLSAELPGAAAEMLALAWWVFAVRLVAAAVRLRLHPRRSPRETRLVSDLIAGAVYIVGGLVILNNVLRVPIGGVLATSGVIAIVLGLALQNTIADVFAGVAVGLEQPFRPGDRIKIGDDIEGDVVQINWRSIRIQTDDADLAIVPNSTVAKAQIVNRSSPSARRCTHVLVQARAEAEPRCVQDMLRHAAMFCPGVLAKPEPTALLERMGLRTNTYRLIFNVADTDALSQVRSELLRQVRRQLQHAGALPVHPAHGDRALAEPEAARRLAEIAVFESLSADERLALAGQLETRRLRPGERLFSQGDVEASLYMVDWGVFEISRREGRGVALDRIGVGEYIGEIGLLTGAPRPVTVTALTDAVVRSLGKAALQPLICARPDLAAAFEASVQRGFALLDREEAACDDPAAARSGLIERILRFFAEDAPR